MTAAARVEVHDGFVRVIDAGARADFHLRWLRHHCDVDRHPVTGERTLDSSELPDELAVARAEIDGEHVAIAWRHDGRVSRFARSWLREHAYALDRELVAPPGHDVARLELARQGRVPAEVAAEALARVAAEGAVVIRGGPGSGAPGDEAARLVDTDAWIAAFAARGLRVIETHFGRIEDLRTDNTTNQHTDQLGYTDAGIELHTDQPFLAQPPRYQLLQAVRAADEGGDSLVADARAAYRYLASLDAEAAAAVRTTPIRFHRQQRGFAAEVIAPLIELAADGGFRVRSSYFTMAPHRLAFAEMAGWYRAYDRFVRLVRDPRHRYQLALAPGDVLVYDNHRMLHGRTAFRGPRWVRGVYFDA